MGRSTFAGSLVLGATLLTVACGGRTAVPQPFPTAHRPPPTSPERADDAPTPDVAGTAAEPLLQTALSLLGAPYVNGGADPSGFDCSGFVAFVFGQHGVALPRTVERQARVGEDVGTIAPGDLVFFRTSGRGPSHVGIALGPDRFIHAPSSRGVVRIELLHAPYWTERFLEARRIPPPSPIPPYR
jgi:cell wall-associated NlpC family hydrolase